MNFKNIINQKKLEYKQSRGAFMKVFASPKTLNTTKLIMGAVIVLPGTELNEHVHDYGEEVVLVVNGLGTLVVDGEKINLKKGDVFLVSQGQRHKIVNIGDKSLELIFSSAPLASSKEKGHRDL